MSHPLPERQTCPDHGVTLRQRPLSREEAAQEHRRERATFHELAGALRRTGRLDSTSAALVACGEVFDRAIQALLDHYPKCACKRQQAAADLLCLQEITHKLNRIV